MLTREETAKIFMMYHGCTYTFKEETYPFEQVYYVIDENNDFSTSYDSKLLLTPLSAITDEHAVGLYNLVWGDRNETSYKIEWTKRFLEHRDMKGWYMEFDTYTKLIDQLREWGYMLPYKGVDLFTAGIAIVKQ